MTMRMTVPPATRRLGQAFQSEAFRAAERGVRIQAKAYRTQIVADDAVASRQFLNSVRTRTVLKTESVLIKEAFSDVPQARTMETGQKPGFRPPIRAIMRWMGYRGIPGGKSVAFAIAITIERRGIKGRQIARKAYDKSKLDVVREFEKAAQRHAAQVNRTK